MNIVDVDLGLGGYFQVSPVLRVLLNMDILRYSTRTSKDEELYFGDKFELNFGLASISAGMEITF